MGAMSVGHICPVCGYDGLFDAPWDGSSPSDEICPSCGIHFGFDDGASTDQGFRNDAYRAWRENWISSGMRWFSQSRRAPGDWDPGQQLKRVIK